MIKFIFRCRTACRLMVMLGLTLCLGGCNIVGGLYVVASGPPKIPAQHELNADRTTVLFIDDLNNVLPRRALRDRIGQAAERSMLENKVIAEGKLISAASARRVTTGEQADSRLATVDIARRVGAEVMVHIVPRAWTLQSQPGIISPVAVVEVKVIDAADNTRLWPVTEEGFPLVVRVPRGTTEDLGSTLSERMEIENKLADRIGLQIARLFHEHAREQLSEQLRE